MQAANDITFGRFRLDLTNECLWQGAQAISLRPKAFAVLRLLLQRPGMLVTKQQVLDTVWPGTFVGDAVLKDNIRQLREALEDDAGSPTYIETAHRRGYRFIGQVSEGLTGKAATATQPILSPPELKDAPRTASTNVNAILGREAELAKMRGWLDWALAGESQIVFVTGEPGIGKTTLVEAFLQLASQSSAILVARGQCLEHYGSGEAYLPVLDGFSRLCRSPGGPPVVNLLRQQAPAWLAQMPSVVSQSERENLQTQLVGATRERMLREMADAIETLTSESPLLLVLEDLHWSDYSTLDLVSYLARRRPARLFVIGTYRPVDVILGDHPLKGVKRELQAHGLCHELPLEYLAEEVVEQYLRARFPRHQLPSRLRGAIYRRTEGNPLFMINLVKYLTDQDIIVEEEGTWKLRGELSEVEDSVPANLRQLIEKQIERLTPDERTVLEGASVAGMECSSVAIAAGLNLPVEWVERHCEELARRHQFLSPGWLVELPDGNVTVRYRFVHILYRDVPYRLMPPMRRSQIHHRIAECGVAIYGSRASEITAELAMHFEQSRDWARALEYLLQAAENATRKSAHHEAAGLARRGLEALKPLPKSIELTRQEITLRMILTVSLMATKGFASSEVANFSADGKYVSELSGASPQSFNMLYLVGFSYIMSGNIRPALAIADRLLGLAAKLKDPTLDMEAHRAMGVTLIEQGKCTEALEHLNQASDLYSANRHHPYTLNIGHDCKVLSECFAGRALWTLGFPDAALRRMQGAFAFAKELSHPQSSVGAAHFACELHQLRGEPLLAQLQAREVLKLADEYGLEYWVALGKIDLGWADAELGDLQHGIEQLQQGVAAYQATGGKLWCPRFLSLLACAFGKAARVEEGLTAITEALTMAELNGETYAMPELLRIKGELLLENTDPLRLSDYPTGDRSELSASLEAQACFTEAIAIAKQQKTRSWELRAYMSMDQLNTLQGKPDHTHLSKSYASFTEGYETADLKQARTLLNAALPS